MSAFVLQKGNTALHYACQRKSQGIVPLLLEKHADVSIKNNVSHVETVHLCVY